MTDKLELTPNERIAANQASNKAVRNGWVDHNVVQAILDAVNEVRSPKPDPIGTIRSRPDFPQLAIRSNDGWHVVAHDSTLARAGHQFLKGDFPTETWGGSITGKGLRITDWPIVYTPE